MPSNALPKAAAVAAGLLIGLMAPGCTCGNRFSPTDGGDGIDSGNLVCIDGSRRCADSATVHLCQGGTWIPDDVCISPAICNSGACASPCDVAEASRSYIGCHYYAVDLHNWDEVVPGQPTTYIPQDAQFAVVVSAASDAKGAVNVRIYSKFSGSEIMVDSGTVFAGSTTTFNLPGTQGIPGPGITPAAYRIEADSPITAYQFNPLNNTQEAFSNDASLLLPVHALDTFYLAVTADGIGPQGAAGIGPKTPFVTVIAVEDGTSVTLTPNAALMSGPGIPGGTGPVTATLNRYDVLNVEALVPDGVLGGQLSGTMVEASFPVAVFAGTVCSNMPPDLGTCCCDHLEEQMIPLSAWGERFAVARAAPLRPGNPEPNYYRIVGGTNGITLSYAPSAPPGAPATLGMGESVEFSTATSFTIESAGGPILVTQFLPSSTVIGPGGSPCFSDGECGGLGYEAACFIDPVFGLGQCVPVSDPAMLIVPPVEQFRSEYVFLTPADYASDWATIIAPAGAVVTLDGTPVTGFTPIGSLAGVTWSAANVPLTDGTHTVIADQESGVLVYGFDIFVSYSYAAGLNIEQIYIR